MQVRSNTPGYYRKQKRTMARLNASKEAISSQRTTWVAFAALTFAANVPTLLTASVASPAHLAACVTAQGITLYVVLLAFLRPRITLIVYGILLLFIFPFDAISIIGTNSPLSYGMISATLKTTPPEAFAQIKENLHFIILFIAAITAYFIVLFRYIPWRFKLSSTSRFFAPIAALICTLTITIVATIPYANRIGQTKNREVQTTTDKSFLLLFPIRDAKLISAYVKDEREIKEKLYPDSLSLTLFSKSFPASTAAVSASSPSVKPLGRAAGSWLAPKGRPIQDLSNGKTYSSTLTHTAGRTSQNSQPPCTSLTIGLKKSAPGNPRPF